MTINVNSKNRLAARKLLTFCGVPATQVRTMPCGELSLALQRAINEQLITKAQVEKHLALDPKAREDRANSGSENRADSNGAADEAEDARDEGGAADGNAETDGNDDRDDDGRNGSAESADDDNAADGSESDSDGNESSDDGMTEQERQSYEEGKRDGANGNERDDDHAEDGYENLQEAYDRGYEDGKNGNDDASESNDDASNDDDETTEQDDEVGEKAAEDAANGNDESNDSDDDDEDDGSEIEHPALARIVKYIAAGQNVALVGPAGTGKSFIARQVARKLDRDFFVNGACMSKYDLIGYCDAGGVYHSTPAHDAFVNGGVHCFDELDASAPDAIVAFNGMTDDQPFFTFPNGQQQKHEQYTAIACMNTFGNGATAEYVGRYKQDAAAMDRFVMIHIDYDARVEKRIAGKHDDILQRVRALRQACSELGIKKVCSYRMISKAVAGRSKGVSKRDLDTDVFFSGLDDSAVRQLKTRVNAIVREANENA